MSWDPRDICLVMVGWKGKDAVKDGTVEGEGCCQGWYGGRGRMLSRMVRWKGKDAVKDGTVEGEGCCQGWYGGRGRMLSRTVGWKGKDASKYTVDGKYIAYDIILMK